MRKKETGTRQNSVIIDMTGCYKTNKMPKTRFDQTKLFLKPSLEFNSYMYSPLPDELMVKIFYHLVNSAEDPIDELMKLCQVCEGWRQIILHAPCLWNRLDLTKIPVTSDNISILNRIYSNEFVGKISIEEIEIKGVIYDQMETVLSFMESALTSPNLKKLNVTHFISSAEILKGLSRVLMRCIKDCSKLESITIGDSKELVDNQEWLSDFLSINDNRLRNLNLSQNYCDISPQLQTSIYQYCPNLIELDLTYIHKTVDKFDATELASKLGKLEVLRLGGVRFRPITSPPDKYGLTNLREITVPFDIVRCRDENRSDLVFATLAYGSTCIRVIDIRGWNISVETILNMPSNRVEEFKMDDICPNTRHKYHLIVKKWSKSLTKISLVEIESATNIGCCLRSLDISIIREIDLRASFIHGLCLRNLIRKAKHLESLDLRSCYIFGSFARGEVYKRNPIEPGDIKLGYLLHQLDDLNYWECILVLLSIMIFPAINWYMLINYRDY